MQQIRSGEPPEGLASAGSGYIAREPFIAFHERRQRWAVLVCHRRCGKTVACIMDLIDAATRFEGERGRFCYIAPFYVQAKTVAWDYVKAFTMTAPGVRFNESELYVEFAHNGARIQLQGADNYERLRGQYFDGIVMDEFGARDAIAIGPRCFPQRAVGVFRSVA